MDLGRMWYDCVDEYSMQSSWMAAAAVLVSGGNDDFARAMTEPRPLRRRVFDIEDERNYSGFMPDW